MPARSTSLFPRRLSATAASLALAAALAAASAAANVIVLRSDVDEIARGDVLERGAEFALAAEEEVRVMTPDGATRVLLGPGVYLVGALPGADSAPVEAYGRALAYLSTRPESEASALASRAPTGAAVVINGVPFVRPDGFCYAPGVPVFIARVENNKPERLRVTVRGFDPVEIDLSAEESYHALAPKDLFLRDGAVHTITFENGPSATLTPREVAADRLYGVGAANTLLANGCEQQFEAFLD